MAAETFLIDGNADLSVSAVDEVILERGEDRQPTKVISKTVAAELTKKDQDFLKTQGVKVKKVTKDEAQEVAREAATAPADSALTAPSVGQGVGSNPDKK